MRMVRTPPYVGVPRLSHHFPVVAVELLVVGGIVIVAWLVVVVVVVGLIFVVVVVVVDVLELVQEAKTNDVRRRQVRTIQIVPLFI